jgi:death-on-curing protein
LTRRLKLEEVLEIHQEILNQSGGTAGVRDLGALKSSISQPFQSFGDTENFPTVEE